ncbi:glutathione transferase GstA [Myxococcota bacterium]|nr:glutathione transferase GstA [Myxococcota bacterium]
MKLYYSLGACSFAPHIVLHELGGAFEAESVDLGTKVTKSGADYRAVSPKGYVPALVLDDGAVLTEAAAVLQYLADQKPEAKLAPAWGTMERYRLIELLTFISSEIHKGFSPLFNPKTPAETKAMVVDTLGVRIGWVDQMLAGKPYLMGEQFTIADAYLYTVLSWTKYVNIDLSTWSNVSAFMARVADRPSVKAARAAEKAARG